MIISLSGCVVAIGNGSKHEKHDRHEPPRPVVYVPAGTQDSVAIAEIDAAASLGVEGARMEALGRVASRPDLSPATTQVHLVNTALSRLDLESNRLGLILTLIANPAFDGVTAEAIYRQIDRFALESSKQQVIGALQSRPRH